MFQRLSVFRDVDMSGPRRLSPMHIHYGLLNLRERLSPEEIDALGEIDLAWLATPELPPGLVESLKEAPRGGDGEDEDDEDDLPID